MNEVMNNFYFKWIFGEAINIHRESISNLMIPH